MTRADALLVTRGLAPSRTAAQRLIAAGRVFLKVGAGETALAAIAKPAQDLPDSALLTVTPDAADRYVSRGGMKLAGALAASGLDVRGKACLDVGQSTGGFTDCLLQAGAASVVGVDVGHGQLHARLREDARVTCLEGVNARGLRESGESALAGRRFDLIVGDLSFISLTLVLPELPAFLADGGAMLLLVKPQFEVGPEHLGKGGVVRDAARYPAVEAKLREAATALGLTVRGWFDSPLIGGGAGNIRGNREFFIWIEK